MAAFTRQPFAELGTPRLQVLQSAKNRQNAISQSFASPLKPIPAPSTGKRQRAPEVFEDVDSENMDPSVFSSPTKKSKTTSISDAGFIKPAKFSLFTSPVQPATRTASPSVPSVRKALSPSSTKSTPITTSRGSPKHKRVHAISKHRRTSSSPFRRVDPPSFTQSSPSLPFSIDAALSGTIQGYTPKPSAPATPATPASAPVQHVSTLEDSMPKSWFFDIHEDTPEQEAANLMEHSASVLDISSDDDLHTKKHNEDLERGKENIPPPDFLAAQLRGVGGDAMEMGAGLVEEPVKRPRLRTFVQDAMEEDRKPLGDLPPSEFYGEGCDASSYVTVDVGIEKPSGLSRECDFSGDVAEEPVVESEVEVAVVPAEEEIVVAPVGEPVAVEDQVAVHVASPLPQEVVDIAPAVEAPTQSEQEALTAPAIVVVE